MLIRRINGDRHGWSDTEDEGTEPKEDDQDDDEDMELEPDFHDDDFDGFGGDDPQPDLNDIPNDINWHASDKVAVTLNDAGLLSAYKLTAGKERVQELIRGMGMGIITEQANAFRAMDQCCAQLQTSEEQESQNMDADAESEQAQTRGENEDDVRNEEEHGQEANEGG